MRKIKFLSVLVLLVLAVSAGSSTAVGQGPSPQGDVGAVATPTNDVVYVLDDADPNESAEIARAYWKGVELIRQGQWGEAKAWFTGAVSRYPDSRHLHEGLAQVLWYLAIEGPEGSSALEQATHEIVRAMEIGLGFGKVRHTWLVAQILGRTGDIETLDDLFGRALVLEPTFQPYLHYALGLSLLDDPKAEEIYRRAIKLQPEGNMDALAYYGEWLLDHGRETEVLAFLPADSHIEYLHFLRGVALERLERLDEARAEYARFVDFSANFPAPSRFRILGSLAQTGIRFEGDASINTTDSQARVGLSTLIYGEAGGESTGGQRAMGWVVRNRVLRGSVGQPACPYVTNSGATLADKYKSVMCQSGQFAGMCSAWCSDPSTTTCPKTSTTDHNASDVYNGYAPDPVKSGGYCPGGYKTSTCPDGICEPCWSVVHCWGGIYGYSTAGGLFNIGVDSTDPNSCPSHFCAPTNRRMVCNDGVKPNNCFYTNP